MDSYFDVEELFSMECRKGNVELIDKISNPKKNIEMEVPSIKKKLFRTNSNLFITLKNISNAKKCIFTILNMLIYSSHESII